MPRASRVHDTALRELERLLGTQGPLTLEAAREDALPPHGIFIGTVSESRAANRVVLAGRTNLHNVPPSLDAYDVLVFDGTLMLLGNTPRGMLHAVYALHEHVREHGRTIVPDIRLTGTFRLPYRIFHQRRDVWPGSEADIRYISLLGASHCLLTHDWQGDLRHFQGYVTSPIFPEAIAPDTVARNHKALRSTIDTCLDYGLDPCLWITELPCQGGPWVPEPARQAFLERFPPEILSDSGTYQGKVLCFSHPTVQEFYRDLVRRFFADFPEIGILFLFGLDADGEFCDPEQCTRCAGMSKFDQRDRLIRFLIEEGGQARPGLRVLTTGWGWDRQQEEFYQRQRDLPTASGLYMAAQTDGWHSERQVHAHLREARAICAERNQLFIGYDDLHWGDCSVFPLRDLQDFPLGIQAKLERWRDLNADGIFDHWGTVNQDIPCNSIACREFFLNPYADPHEVCRDLARKQFGETAGDKAFQAWCALEKAHAILSNHCVYAPPQWFNWYDGREFPPLPEEFETKAIRSVGMRHENVFPPVVGAVTPARSLRGIADAWRQAYPHYAEAAALLEEAAALAEDVPVFYAFWWSGDTSSPSRKEHLEREKVFVEAVGEAGREIGLHFALNALYLELDGDAKAYAQQAGDLLREDAAACRHLAGLFERYAAEGAAPPDRAADWAAKYREKASRIDAYLADLAPK